MLDKRFDTFDSRGFDAVAHDTPRNVADLVRETSGIVSETSHLLDEIIRNLTGYQGDKEEPSPEPSCLLDVAALTRSTSADNIEKVNQIIGILFK